MSMIRDILARFDALMEGQNAAQRSVPQLPAEFKPKDISPVLGAPEKPHPTSKYFVGGESAEPVAEYMPMPEPLTDDTVMELSPETLAQYRQAALQDKQYNLRGIAQANRMSRIKQSEKDWDAAEEWDDEARFFRSVNDKRNRGIRRADRGMAKAAASHQLDELKSSTINDYISKSSAAVRGGMSNTEESQNESPPEKDSLEYKALKRMKGPTEQDAIEALVVEIGIDRFRRDRQYYRELIPFLVRHYGQQNKVNELKSSTINDYISKSSAAVRGGRKEVPKKVPSWKVAAGKVNPDSVMGKYAKVKAGDLQGVAEGLGKNLVYISKDKVKDFEDWMESEGLETAVPKQDKGLYVVYDYSNADHTSKVYADEWNEKEAMAEGGYYNPLDQERREQDAMDQERRDFKRREMEYELRNEPKNNYQVSIDGRAWKVFGDRAHAEAVARKLQAKGKRAAVHVTGAPISESATTEDVVSKGGKNLGDYLQDVAKIIKKDPELLDRVAQELDKLGPAVKTLHTDDGHEIKIHGNEDDGFRISIKNRTAKGRFRDLDEARMAVELFVARRRKHSADNSDYVDEK